MDPSVASPDLPAAGSSPTASGVIGADSAGSTDVSAGAPIGADIAGGAGGADVATGAPIGAGSEGAGPDPAADRAGLPVAAAVAPVGLLGAAGAAAWAVHRRNAREDAEADVDEDEE
jgi:hypothetical protein